MLVHEQRTVDSTEQAATAKVKNAMHMNSSHPEYEVPLPPWSRAPSPGSGPGPNRRLGNFTMVKFQWFPLKFENSALRLMNQRLLTNSASETYPGHTPFAINFARPGGPVGTGWNPKTPAAARWAIGPESVSIRGPFPSLGFFHPRVPVPPLAALTRGCV